MAQPSLTLHENELMKTGKAVTSAMLPEANGQRLQLRTVVRNFTADEQLFTLHLTVRDKAMRVKYSAEKAVRVAPKALKSLALVTDELKIFAASDVVSWYICEGENRRIVSKNVE